MLTRLWHAAQLERIGYKKEPARDLSMGWYILFTVYKAVTSFPSRLLDREW